MSKEVVVTVKADTKDAQKNVKDLNKDLKKTETDLSGVESSADSATGGLINGFKGSIGAIKGVVKGFKTLKGAIAATGIGLLVVLFASLKEAFEDSEEGANKFSRILGVLGTITDNVLDLFADLGEAIISAFENPKEALNSFVNLLKNQVVNRINGLMELIPALGKAVQLVFDGEFSEAGKVAANAVGKVALGVEDVTDKIKAATEATKEFIQENIDESKKAIEVADMRAKANKLERELLVERSVLENKIANLRLKSRQEEEFTAEQRKGFILEAQELQDSLLKKETEVLELRFKAQEAQNEFGRSNIEALDKTAEAEAALNRQSALRLNQQKATQKELNSLNRQILAEQKRIANEKKAIDDAELKRKQEVIEAEKIALAIKKAAEEKAEQEELTREEQQWNMLQKLRNTAQEQELLELTQQYEKKLELAEGNIELEKALEIQRNIDLGAIEEKYTKETNAKINADNEKLAANEKQLNNQKVQGVMNSLEAIANISALFAGESKKEQKKAFKIQKAVSISQTLISTAQSAIDSYKSLSGVPVVGPVLGFAASAAAVTAGLAQVKQISSQRFDGGSTASAVTTPSVSTGGASASQAPSFNVVGQSQANQVSMALANQPPAQAFVVAGDVTTAQQLNNNTIQQATF